MCTISSGMGYQNKAIFLELVVKTCQNEKFCWIVLFFSLIFMFCCIRPEGEGDLWSPNERLYGVKFFLESAII